MGFVKVKRRLPYIKLGFGEITADCRSCHSEERSEESYSTDFLQAECFLSETGAVRSFAALRMTVKRGPFSVERRAGACPRRGRPQLLQQDGLQARCRRDRYSLAHIGIPFTITSTNLSAWQGGGKHPPYTIYGKFLFPSTNLNLSAGQHPPFSYLRKRRNDVE